MEGREWLSTSVAVSNVFVGPWHVQTHTLSFTLHYKKKAHTGKPLGTQNINKYPSSISPCNHPRFQDLPVTLANLSSAPCPEQLKGKQKCSWWLFPLADIILFIFLSKLNKPACNRREERCHVGGFFWSKIKKKKEKCIFIWLWPAEVQMFHSSAANMCNLLYQTTPPANILPRQAPASIIGLCAQLVAGIWFPCQWASLLLVGVTGRMPALMVRAYACSDLRGSGLDEGMEAEWR